MAEGRSRFLPGGVLLLVLAFGLGPVADARGDSFLTQTRFLHDATADPASGARAGDLAGLVAILDRETSPLERAAAIVEADGFRYEGRMLERLSRRPRTAAARIDLAFARLYCHGGDADRRLWRPSLRTLRRLARRTADPRVRYLLALSLAQVDAFGAARAPWEETTVRKAAAARHLCRAARDLRGAGTDDARRVLAAMRVAVTYVLRYPGYAPFRSALEAALGGGGTRIGPRGVGEDGDRRTDRAPGSPAGAPCHRRGATGDPASRNRRRG